MDTIIHLNSIIKNYIVGTQIVKALRSVSTSINRNEYVAIMGPSGSGKSTLMNIIGCLDTPTNGSYILNGKDVSKLEDNQLAEIRNTEIGFVFQTFNLLPRYTALENIMLPLIYAGLSKHERLIQAEEVIESVGLTDRKSHRPNELSGGQRQRVALGRAMVNRPSIILADEPTGNLDSKTSVDIMGLFQEIHRKGNTIIVVTHEEVIARHAKRIIRLMDGQVESDRLNKKPVIEPVCDRVAQCEYNQKSNQMTIYTKGGDTGETSLIGGKRVLKSDIRIEAYGTVDELIAFVGLLRDQPVSTKISNDLIKIQDKLMICAAILAADCDDCKDNIPELKVKNVDFLEKEIDAMIVKLPPLNLFILPGGHQVVSVCNVVRTVCRRAERRIIELHRTNDFPEIIIRYINRLSDYFFVLSRLLSADYQVNEIKWVSNVD